MTWGRELAGVREMLSRRSPALFPLQHATVPRPLTDAQVRKIAVAIDRARLGSSDAAEVAERMIVQLLLTAGVPEAEARAVWDFRKKREKRRAGTVVQYRRAAS